MKPVLALWPLMALLVACGGSGSSTSAPVYSLDLSMNRLATGSPSPFQVTVTLAENGNALSGRNLDIQVPAGAVSALSDHGDGSYSFTVTPASTGVYPVTVSYGGVSVRRDAVVLDSLGSGVGQPMAVPGDYVNTEGYEDGITITPDGQYLFVQYGPVYFSGILYISTICADVTADGVDYSLFDINNCAANENANWVFTTTGPYGAPQRPGFPDGRISGTSLSHLSSVVVAGVANGLYVPPTTFYGFVRQPDGSFAEPFRLGFTDENRGIQSAYGLSFRMTGTGSADYTVSWNDYTNQLGDDGADVYSGSLVMGQDTSMGSVTYSGDFINTSSPLINPLSFTDTTGVQGNSHIHYDAGGIDSVWTDDEVNSKDLSVYLPGDGTLAAASWTRVTLPAKINTAAEESQPFFDGNRLYLRRDNAIVAHTYTGAGAGYGDAASWADAELILGSNFNQGIGEIIAVGEPTLANVDGRTLLYFVYGKVRADGAGGYKDINMDAGFVELP